ncbi:hypothetical protein JTB14_026847 [Gonioctena quinquepunctata]|nr:hypothetical protein JTB14_026847 [Gonioctena quinquepunctata]
MLVFNGYCKNMADCSRSRPLTQNELEEALYESDISFSDTEDPQYIQPNLRNDHNGASSDSDSSDSEPIERDRPVSEISLSSSLMHRSTKSTRVSRRPRGYRAPTRVRNTSVHSNGTSAQLVNNEWTEIIVVASNRTYLEKKGSELRLTTKELKVFIDVLFVMSTIDLPQIRMFWSKKYGVAIIKNAITRNRFFDIRTSLKVVYDPEVGDAEKANKIWKVMPPFRSILRGCQAQIRTDNISIDEMIITFTGHCGIRQFCPRKPNPMGINIFVLANPNGIVCDMTVYQGDSTFSADLIQQGFTLGESAVISLCDTLVPVHHIYSDRYFTTIKLADVLLERGFHATEKLFVKNPRGTTETKVRGDGIITIHRWLDNKPVTILSTCHAAKNPDQCRRWSKRKKEYEMLRFFKLALGEQLISDNTLSSDSESSSNYEELEPKHKKRKVEIKPIPAEASLITKADHLVDYAEKQQRCRKVNCNHTTTVFCIKCKIFLCNTQKRNCFLQFHSRNLD